MARKPKTEAKPLGKVAKKPGRPPKYNPDMLPFVAAMARLGATYDEVAKAFGVTKQAVHRWMDAHPEFAAVFKEGADHADNMVEQSLFKRACGFSHEAVKIFNDQGQALVVPYTEQYPPDTTACIFWLKNRRSAKWRDKQVVEMEGEGLAALLQKRRERAKGVKAV